MRYRSKKAFTLAEVLIALALLGIIAAFAIPKVLQGTANTQRNALLKETVSVLSEMTYAGVLNQQLKPSTFRDYFLSRMNCAVTCSGNSMTGGCWDTTKQGNPSEALEPGCILKNGVVMVGLSNLVPTQGCNGILIDWNGTQGPNDYGKDWLWINVSFMPDTTTTSCIGMQPGTVTSNSLRSSVPNSELFSETMR